MSEAVLGQGPRSRSGPPGSQGPAPAQPSSKGVVVTATTFFCRGLHFHAGWFGRHAGVGRHVGWGGRHVGWGGRAWEAKLAWQAKLSRGVERYGGRLQAVLG
jgi:hypothetical protein